MERLKGWLSPVQSLSGSLSFPVDISTPVYIGEYEVTPAAGAAIILETNGKKMTDDVTVHEIPCQRVSNISGGITVTIG